ncbi:MAG: hypothetical protein GX433_13175 [Deltaproteobacteria bacterium]|nr:hypothetical protein [Deltaproteobacteria bacterium]
MQNKVTLALPRQKAIMQATLIKTVANSNGACFNILQRERAQTGFCDT